jgi:hypothetical protein
MAIDYIIDYDCIPKQTLTTVGILERIKGRERAESIIRLYRENGDERPPSEMGFEMVRNAADGSEEIQIIVVQHLLDSAAELIPLQAYCEGCPANRSGDPFGCMGQVSYPLSPFGEAWLLNQLPDPPTAPLVWLLLKQGIQEFHYDGSRVRLLRELGRTHFTEARTIQRELGEIVVNSDQVFEMIFMTDNIQPNHAAILLLFFGGLDRNELDADGIMALGKLPMLQRQGYDFLITVSANDDASTGEIKQFLYALFLAWQLDMQLLLDV